MGMAGQNGRYLAGRPQFEGLEVHGIITNSKSPNSSGALRKFGFGAKIDLEKVLEETADWNSQKDEMEQLEHSPSKTRPELRALRLLLVFVANSD
jgi:GDP-D-mannose dehydratase